MNPIRLWKKFARNYRDYGWQALAKSGKALLSPLVEHNAYRVYVLDLRSLSTAHPEIRADLELILLLSADQHDLIQQVEQAAEWLEGHVRQRLAEGDLCVVAVQGRTLAGFNLVTFGDAYIPLLKTTRHFRPGTAWSDHIAVAPAFRRGGLARALRLRMFAELSARGIWKLYGGALRSNTAYLRARPVPRFPQPGGCHLLQAGFAQIVALSPLFPSARRWEWGVCPLCYSGLRLKWLVARASSRCETMPPRGLEAHATTQFVPIQRSRK